MGDTHSYVYGYDAAGRLSSVTRDGANVASYSYDSNSNRLPGTYDNQDRMLAYGGATYTYSGNGELASKTDGSGTTTYNYDELGNLTNVSLPTGKVIEYVIDGQNRRVGKKIAGILVRQWLYGDALRIVAELDGAGGVISRFVYGSRVNVPDYVIRGGVTYRIISDHLGSPRVIADSATELVAQRMDFDEFGNVVADTNPGFTPFGFAGGLFDGDTNLVRFGARDYDHRVGRWTAKDPVLFGGGDTNHYGYTTSDPINFSDESGLAVFIGTHPALVPGDPANHAALVLRPDNPSEFVGNPLFRSTGGREATLGGQAFGIGPNYSLLPTPYGRLRGAPNYPGDNPRNLSHLTPVSCPTGMTDTQFIGALTNAASRYGDTAPYSPLPSRFGPYFNSNSYAAGVIRAAGGTPPPLPVSVPGYSKPLSIP